MQLLFSTIYFTFLLTFAHPFYVSIAELHYNQKAASVEITVKLFTDDLEEAIEAQSVEKLNLGLKDEHEKTDFYLETYLKKSLFVDINGIQTEMEYVGKEVEMDATWIYLEIKDVQEIKTVDVKNTILTELKEEQTNIVHLNVGKEKKSLLLNKKESSGLMKFE